MPETQQKLKARDETEEPVPWVWRAGLGTPGPGGGFLLDRKPQGKDRLHPVREKILP